MVDPGMSATALRAVRNCPPSDSASAWLITWWASPGSPNSVISAPAANSRSPPVTTTAPGGSSRRSTAAASSWRSSSWDSAFTFGLSSRSDGHAVVAALDVDQRCVGHRARR